MCENSTHYLPVDTWAASACSSNLPQCTQFTVPANDGSRDIGLPGCTLPYRWDTAALNWWLTEDKNKAIADCGLTISLLLLVIMLMPRMIPEGIFYRGTWFLKESRLWACTTARDLDVQTERRLKWPGRLSLELLITIFVLNIVYQLQFLGVNVAHDDNNAVREGSNARASFPCLVSYVSTYGGIIYIVYLEAYICLVLFSGLRTRKMEDKSFDSLLKIARAICIMTTFTFVIIGIARGDISGNSNNICFVVSIYPPSLHPLQAIATAAHACDEHGAFHLTSL